MGINFTIEVFCLYINYTFFLSNLTAAIRMQAPKTPEIVLPIIPLTASPNTFKIIPPMARPTTPRIILKNV